MLDATFSALTDPTRRAIVRMLSEGPKRAGELYEAFPISAPAISRHVRVLRENGVVEQLALADDGRVRVYGLRPGPLQEVREWADDVNRSWQAALESFKDYVEKGDRK